MLGNQDVGHGDTRSLETVVIPIDLLYLSKCTYIITIKPVKGKMKVYSEKDMVAYRQCSNVMVFSITTIFAECFRI